MLDLGTLPGDANSFGSGINSTGHVVGNSETRAFLWRSGSGMIDLGNLPGGFSSFASDINDLGSVVGTATNSSFVSRAFLWQSGSGMTDLGVLAGGFDSSGAMGINNAGQVVGNSFSSRWGTRAFLWQSGSGMIDLGSLDPGSNLSSGRSFSSAKSINDAGQVVGYSYGASGPRAVLWQGSSGILDLGVLSDGDNENFSEAYDINSAGLVVGRSGQRAFLWEIGSGMTDLNNLLVRADPRFRDVFLSEATGINDFGEIVAWGSLNPFSGDVVSTEAFLLTPVPLPASAWLIVAGLAMFSAVARNRTARGPRC
jgi:probable HAF family extracellular repeat protein